MLEYRASIKAVVYNREQAIGNREQGTGNGERGTGNEERDYYSSPNI
ncbi:MAG: hypothetical protein AB4426_16960 [Xenococcaceae cyanobacterium]